HFGPGATVDSAPSTNEDLVVPHKEWAALDQVISEQQLKGQNMKLAVRTLNDYFLGHFTYRSWQRGGRTLNPNETPLSRFLLRTPSGHCEYFATAGVLLLRRIGIPARYAVGYAVHEGSGSKFVVRQRDAHAWCLVWNDHSRTWQDFDFTPGSWIEAEAIRSSRFQWF